MTTSINGSDPARCDAPGAHCDFCLAVVPLYRKGRVEFYSKHYPENAPWRRGENECLCEGSDKRVVGPGEAFPKRRSWRKRLSSLLRRG